MRTSRRPRDFFLARLDDFEVRLRRLERALRLGVDPVVLDPHETELQSERESDEPEHKEPPPAA